MTVWLNRLRWIVGGLGAAASLSLASAASAQDGAFTELYGYGVHRYYAGDYNEAQRVLNMVIDAGIEDPRPHYFRGLVTYQMGMQDAAKADFEHAADLEARGKGVVNVANALQRIQGPVRRDIELARLTARVAVAQEQRANKQVQTEQSRSNPNIAKPPAADALPPTLSTPAPAVEAAAPTTPADEVTPATPDAATDPFKDDAAVPAPTTPATDDPFGSAPAAPATPVAPVEDPFK